MLKSLIPEVKNYLKTLNEYGVEETVISIMDRNFIKGWTMRFLYLEGTYSRAINLISTLKSKEYNKFSILEESMQNKIAFKIA